jgi:hypothetical protein
MYAMKAERLCGREKPLREEWSCGVELPHDSMNIASSIGIGRSATELETEGLQHW